MSLLPNIMIDSEDSSVEDTEHGWDKECSDEDDINQDDVAAFAFTESAAFLNTLTYNNSAALRSFLDKPNRDRMFSGLTAYIETWKQWRAASSAPAGSAPPMGAAIQNGLFCMKQLIHVILELHYILGVDIITGKATRDNSEGPMQLIMLLAVYYSNVRQSGLFTPSTKIDIDVLDIVNTNDVTKNTRSTDLFPDLYTTLSERNLTSLKPKRDSENVPHGLFLLFTLAFREGPVNDNTGESNILTEYLHLLSDDVIRFASGFRSFSEVLFGRAEVSDVYTLNVFRKAIRNRRGFVNHILKKKKFKSDIAETLQTLSISSCFEVCLLSFCRNIPALKVADESIGNICVGIIDLLEKGFVTDMLGGNSNPTLREIKRFQRRSGFVNNCQYLAQLAGDTSVFSCPEHNSDNNMTQKSTQMLNRKKRFKTNTQLHRVVNATNIGNGHMQCMNPRLEAILRKLGRRDSLRKPPSIIVRRTAKHRYNPGVPKK